MPIRPYQGQLPRLGQRVYVDQGAHLIGDVELGDDVSLWPGVVVRGDVNYIRIGARTNVQDGSIIHVSHDGPYTRPGGYPTIIGADVTIGHGAIVHACVTRADASTKCSTPTISVVPFTPARSTEPPSVRASNRNGTVDGAVSSICPPDRIVIRDERYCE